MHALILEKDSPGTYILHLQYSKRRHASFRSS